MKKQVTVADCYARCDSEPNLFEERVLLIRSLSEALNDQV